MFRSCGESLCLIAKLYDGYANDDVNTLSITSLDYKMASYGYFFVTIFGMPSFL